MGRAKPKPSRTGGRKKPPKKSERDLRLEAWADELRDLAESVGIQVRRERLMREVGYHARSGFCRVNGEDVLFIDHNTSPDLQVELLLSALDGRDLSDLEVSDEVSRLISGEKDVA